MKRARWLAVVCVMVHAGTSAQWTPDFSLKFARIATPSPSPERKWAVWAEDRPVVDTERSEWLSHVFVGAVDGSRTVQLTRGDKGDSNPVFRARRGIRIFPLDARQWQKECLLHWNSRGRSVADYRV